jgi:hypothetical protein
VALSDQKICDLLTRDKIVICRRTITKYRKKLNLPSARHRKLYKLCKSYHDIKCINDIHVTLKDQIEHFFTYYKDLDEGKWVKIDGWGNAEEAKQELLESFAAYKK